MDGDAAKVRGSGTRSIGVGVLGACHQKGKAAIIGTERDR
ncbi:unnamed protein product [Ectocarpus sp. CCAP 1310/34]|nr:unnamed protein product [Ectocarpus sp. CCAP 1310/34]